MYDTNFHHLALLASHIRIHQACNEPMNQTSQLSRNAVILKASGYSGSFIIQSFKKAVTLTRAVIRFKNSQKNKSKPDEDDAEPTSTSQLRLCDRCLSASKGPNVMCSRCSLSSFLSTNDILI